MCYLFELWLFEVRVRNFCAALIGGTAIAAGSSMAASPQAAAKSASPQQLQFDFKATVQADGTVRDIQPDASLPEAIQAMVRRRAATWRYKPMQWQGKAYLSPVAQTIKAVAVPTTRGGFALRIEDVTGQALRAESLKEFFASRPPSEYPYELQRRGVSAILVYAVMYGEAGKPRQVDLVHPAKLDRDIKRFDESARNAIARWDAKYEFAGAPISCRANIPITFQVSDSGGVPAPLRVPPEVAASFN